MVQGLSLYLHMVTVVTEAVRISLKIKADWTTVMYMDRDHDFGNSSALTWE